MSIDLISARDLRLGLDAGLLRNKDVELAAYCGLEAACELIGARHLDWNWFSNLKFPLEVDLAHQFVRCHLSPWLMGLSSWGVGTSVLALIPMANSMLKRNPGARRSPGLKSFLAKVEKWSLLEDGPERNSCLGKDRPDCSNEPGHVISELLRAPEVPEEELPYWAMQLGVAALSAGASECSVLEGAGAVVGRALACVNG